MRAGLYASLAWLGVLHLLVLGADFVAPYEFSAQDRSLPFAPPSRIHLIDGQGIFHWRPFVCSWTPATTTKGAAYEEDCARTYPIRVLVDGPTYSIAGLFEGRTHLFGVESPGSIYLMGTDEFGRDQFSRFLHGGRISLFAATLACGISLLIAAVLGMIAGVYGSWLDQIIMYFAELFLALPWLYLLFGIRAFLPLDANAGSGAFLITGLMGIIGWARPAKLIRGVVLSAKERDYVLAARGFGASNSYILRRHVFPETTFVLLTQASLLTPRYIVAEVTLSFLGLGVSEPAASWGRMLAALQQYHVLTSYWWIYLPLLVLVPTFLAYLTLVSRAHKRQVVTLHGID